MNQNEQAAQFAQTQNFNKCTNKKGDIFSIIQKKFNPCSPTAASINRRELSIKEKMSTVQLDLDNMNWVSKRRIFNLNDQDNLPKPKISSTTYINWGQIFHHKMNTDSALWLIQCEPKTNRLHNLYQIKLPICASMNRERIFHHVQLICARRQ